MATANATVKAVLDYLDQKSSQSVPTGMVACFALSAVPSGWLLCNGSNVSRTTYANLFKAIGTRFGSGDGSTTFTLPNLHRRFAEFSTTISEIGQAVEAGLPNIIGNVSTFASWAGGANDGALIRYESQNANIAGGSGQAIKVNIGFNAAHSFALYGKSSFVQPASLRFLPCIKA